MKNKIVILVVMTIVIFLSGCIQSNTSQIDALSSTINSHIKNGDQYYNSSGKAVNQFQYSTALSYCNNASSEFNLAQKSAKQGLTYAENSNDTVYINYMQDVVNELDAKINATEELKTAISYLQDNDTVNANIHIGNTNDLMNNAVQFNNLRLQILKDNPTKFK